MEHDQTTATDDIVACLKIIKDLNRKKDVLDAFEDLKALSKGHNPNKEGIALLGGSDILLDLLSHDDIEIQREAVRLLRSISVNEQAQERLSADGAVPVLLQLLNTTDDFSLNLGATAVLWNLSVNDENKRTIIAGGGLPILLDLIRTGDVKLQNEAVGCMRNLSVDPSNKKVMGAGGAVPSLVSLLRCQEEKIQKNAALTLRNLSAQNEKNIRRLEAAKGTDILMKVLGDYNLDTNRSIMNNLLLQKLNFESTVEWDALSPFLSKKVGEGKYGDVYLGRYHGYPVACKILKSQIDDKDAEQTLEELNFMKKLKHPNIVLLMGACLNTHNQVVIMTEYAERGCLKDILPDIKSLWLRLKLGEDVAKGLAWLHAHKIVHRDLKLANLLVTDDWIVKIADFGLSLQWSESVVCRGFKGNVKYSPPEILRARYDKSISSYPYSTKTDTYGFGLILWELVSLEPLFPHIKGKEELTDFVLDGKRPDVPNLWPPSLKDLLSQCWHMDPKSRPHFPEIVRQYDQVVIDMLCHDSAGKKIIKPLWGSNTTTVMWQDFHKVFTEALKPDWKRVKKIHVDCLKSILCDPFDDTVEFQQFCKVVSWFGPLIPVHDFFNRVKDLLQLSSFHGLINQQKASEMVKEHFDALAARSTVYLYRFSNTGLGGFVLSFIDKKTGEISHKKLNRKNDGNLSCVDTKGTTYPSFKALHKAMKRLYHLQKPVPNSPFSVLF